MNFLSEWETWAEEVWVAGSDCPELKMDDVLGFHGFKDGFRAGLKKAAEIVNKNDYRGLHVLDILGNGPGYKK